jgi:electron transport complex protein RnfC
MLDYLPDRRLTGGLRLEAHKAESTAAPIRRGFVPRELILAVRQHHGSAAEPIVSVGQHVLKGELIAVPGPPPSVGVHASTSGRVRAIEERVVPWASRLEPSLCIVLESDGEDRAAEPRAAAWPAERDAQLTRIREGGLAGLGGAVFPTADKLALTAPCKTLIVNGAECEPYISCDDVLMREAPQQVVAGALAMADLLGAPLCIIAIERDKPRAIHAVADASRAAGDPRLKLAELPTIYPAGGERQLVELLTGEEVPSHCYPSDIGHICQNVGTAFALHRLMHDDEPLIARIVTVTGGGVHTPQNVEARIGTPVGELIDYCGGYREGVARLVVGGSMMGYAVPSDDFAVTKASNCLIAATAAEVRDQRIEWPCIRCGECATACPARLLPQELLVAAEAADYRALDYLGLEDCIECGCCDVVCPSHIPLTEQFRHAKRAFALHEREVAFAGEAEQRFQRRERRRAIEREHESQLRDALKSEVRSDSQAKQQAIRAAVERSRGRRAGGRPPSGDETE